MNKIIPFSKEIEFDTNIGEIVSIALDDNLSFTDPLTIKGEFVVRGSNKIDDREEDFSFNIPVLIGVDDKYNTEKTKIMIDDFYYEIVSDKVLRVKIDVMLDNIFYNEKEEIMEINSLREDTVKEVDNEPKKDVIDLFKEDNDTKEYSIYRVYMVNDTDTIESILNKYHITMEDLSEYNDLSNLKSGSKLIIPSVDE